MVLYGAPLAKAL